MVAGSAAGSRAGAVRRGLPPNLLLVTVIAVGGLLSLQGRVNGELARRLHSTGMSAGSTHGAVAAATVSFAVGTMLLLAVVLATHRAGLGRLRRARTRWWWWLGGLAGAAVVGASADGVPQVGVAVVTVCVVAGTTLGALLVDEAGLGPGGRQPVSVLRVGGVALAVVAVALGAVGDRQAAVRPLLFTVLVVAGAAAAVQQAANGQLRLVADDTAVASLVSFAVGLVALVVVLAATGWVSARGWPGQWWLYTGGVMGALYIAIAAATVRTLGVLRLSLATVAGQLVAAVLLDVAWPAPGTRLRPVTVVGAVLTLAAVAITAADRRRPTGVAS